MNSDHKQKIFEEIEALESFCRELENAIDDFEHGLRREQDRLERSGGNDSDIYKRMSLLRDNRTLNIQDLDKTRKRLEELHRILQTDCP